MDHRRGGHRSHFLLFTTSSSVPSTTLCKMLRVWTTVVVLICFTSSPSVSSYRVNSEPLPRQGCQWSNTAAVPNGPPEMTLACNVRTLNSEFWNSTFSPEQRRSTASLQVKCNDKLYFESSFRLNQSFSQLVHLQSINFDGCKIRKIPRGIWNRFQELRTLTIHTHNSDWSPSIGLELETNCFGGLTSLTSLDLSSSNVWTLPDQLLCPSLTNLLKFNISSNRLIELPDEFSRSSSVDASSACTLDLQNIDLSRNSIRRIGRNALSRLSALTQLRLQENLVEELEDAAFGGLTRLRFLNLSSNRLVALPPTIFKSNSNLKELYLQNNSITALSPAVFSSLNQLVLLDLSRNALSSLWIKESVFQDLGQLMVLRLSYNALTYIDSTVFANLMNLQALSLDNNRIENIHSEAFASLTNLHLLDVSRNRLTSIDGTLLGSLFVLRRLYLDHNKIRRLDDAALANTTLRDLGLAGNLLSEVPAALRLGHGLGSIETLDLGENRITAMTNESFFGLGQIYGLRMVDNRILEIPPGFCNPLTKLHILNLAQNKISKISESAFVSCPELRVLRLDSNALDVLPPSLTPQLPSLLWLNVSENRIRWADYRQLPPSIEWLDLSYNSLELLGGVAPSAMPGTKEAAVQFHLRVLDASHNNLAHLDYTTIPPTLETLRVNQNRLTTVAPDTFARAVRLRRVELMGNQLESLPLSAIRLPMVGLDRTLPELFLAGNSFVCDCAMEWLTRVNQLSLLRQYPQIVDLDGILCKSVRASRGRQEVIPFRDTVPSDFLCPYRSHCFALCQCCEFDACDCAMTCPDNCTCYHDSAWSANIVECSNLDYEKIPERIPMEASELYLDGNSISVLGSHIFIGKKNLRVLHLNSSRIELIKNKTFNGLKSLEVLRLEDNSLTKLSGFEFQNLANLRELFLQNNLLQSISGDTFRDLKYLQVLRIDGNSLTKFNVWELSGNGYLNSVMLAHNPWSCECDFIQRFRAWVAGRSSIVVDFSLAQCQFSNVGGWSDTPDSSSLLTVTPTISSICTDELERIPLDEGMETNAIGPLDSDSGGGGSAEKHGVPPPDDETEAGSADETINFHPMDMDSSVMLAIVLSSGVCVILVIALVLIFRKELCALFPFQRQRRKSGFSFCCNGIGTGRKSWIGSPFSSGPSNNTSGERQEDAEKLFDAYFIYNSEDEEILTQKLIPELEDKGGNRFRLCLHRDLCLSLENPWNLEMVLSAAESSKRIVILLSKTFLSKEWTNNSDFRRALQSTLSRHQKKLIFILLPPLSVQNLPSLLTIFPELKGAANPVSTEAQNLLEWTDAQFRTKLRKLFPVPTGAGSVHHHHFPHPGQTFSNVHSIPQHLPGELEWPYSVNIHPQFLNSLGLKGQHQQVAWPHHQHHHHFHPNRLVHPTLGPPVTHGFYDSRTSSMVAPTPVHLPIMFAGQPHGGAGHNHEHQNSVSTISNTYPPLTEQNLSDSTNTLGSLGSEEHVYSTLDTPLQSPRGQGREGVNPGPSKGSSPSGGHMYFV